MPDPSMSTQAELTRAIEAAWAELQTFVAGLTEKHVSQRDDHGWTVKDHLTHLAVWEDSVAVLFRGGRRHEALGIDEAYYTKASFDEINEVIKERHKQMSLQAVTEQLGRVHGALIARVRNLSDADLNRTVRDLFPRAPSSDDRRVIDFLHENTAAHSVEHLPWMQVLLRSPV